MEGHQGGTLLGIGHGLHISGCAHQVGHGWGWSRGLGLGHGWPPHLRWPAPGLGWGLGHGWPLVGWLSTWSASTSAPGCGHNWPLLPSSPQFSPLHHIGSNRLIHAVKFPELLFKSWSEMRTSFLWLFQLEKTKRKENKTYKDHWGNMGNNLMSWKFQAHHFPRHDICPTSYTTRFLSQFLFTDFVLIFNFVLF